MSNVEIPKDDPPPRIHGSRQGHRRLALTPDFVPNQGYLRENSATNNGIDAEYSSQFDGGDGEGVTIYDIG